MQNNPRPEPNGARARLHKEAAEAISAKPPVALSGVPETDQDPPPREWPAAGSPPAPRHRTLVLHPATVAAPPPPRSVTARSLLVRVGFGLLGLVVLLGAGAVSRGGPLATLMAVPTATPAATVRPLPGNLLLGYQETPTAAPPAQVAPLPTVVPATVQPSPESTLSPMPAFSPTAAGSFRLVLQDSNFTGGYTTPDGRYRGRSALWLLAQTDPGPQSSRATASFNLNLQTGGPVGNASLTLTGLDSSEQAETPMSVMLNGQTLYKGPDPLPNDFPAERVGEGNWGSYTWKLDPRILLQGANVLTLTNLDTSATSGYIIIDTAEITWAP